MPLSRQPEIVHGIGINEMVRRPVALKWDVDGGPYIPDRLYSEIIPMVFSQTSTS